MPSSGGEPLVPATAAYQSSPTAGPPANTVRFAAGTLVAQPYRIVGLLGKAGMGEVYRPDDLTLRQAVAQGEGDIAQPGKPAYMAPEQLGGQSATVRSDVNGLGLLLY